LKLVAVVRASGVVQVKYKRQTFLRIILGSEVSLLVRAERPGSLTRIVNPANEVIVVVFFSNTSQISRKGPAQEIAALSD
jgi:hypothetical protein